VRVGWRASCSIGVSIALAVAVGLAAPAAHAVSCTVAASMTGAARAALFDAAHKLGGDVLRGDAAALKTETIPSVARDFSGIAGDVDAVAPGLQGATLTVTNLYALNAADLPSPATASNDDVQFFCSVAGAQMLVTVTLDNLPRGEYALAILHATGVKAPEQFVLILQNTAVGPVTSPSASETVPHWQLAGFFSRPLTMDGHDSTWFWAKARALQAKGQAFSAFFYDEAATYLARPADLFTSNNLDKLSRETAAVEPKGLPGSQPMTIAAGDATFAVTGLRADATLGSLDLRVDTRVTDVADPVAARKQAIALMQTLLSQHPELRDNFHGIWVYETTAAGQTFAVEQPMSALS
jgi:hypothetical protein